MKIYIDWDRMEWHTDEKQLFENLVECGELSSYSDFLADEYADCLEELLKLSEKEKVEVYEQYKMDLKSEFECKELRSLFPHRILRRQLLFPKENLCKKLNRRVLFPALKSSFHKLL